jgi:MFS family permease
MSPRFQIASLFACYGAAGIFWGSLAASFPALQADAGLSDSAFGLALGAMALAALPVMRVFGHWLDRIEPFAIPLAMAAFALGTLMLPIMPGLWGLVAAFAVTGGASGALDIALNNRTARVERSTGARLFNRTHALFPAASLAASAVAGWARGAGVGLLAIFLIVATIIVIAALTEWKAGGHVSPAPRDAVPQKARLKGAILILAAIAAAGAFQEAASQGWAAIFVENVRNGTPFMAGLAPAAFTLGLTVGRLLAHEVEHKIAPISAVRVAAIAAAAGFAIVASGVPLSLTLVAFFVAGMGAGPVEPAVFRAVATRKDGPARGPALAAVTAVAYLGYLLSPPLLGFVADGFGFVALWGVCAAVAVLVFGLASRLGISTASR